jgi:hypothetical protein
MDIPPFEDGNTKVDFYFAKLIDSLQGEVVKANVIKDCYVVDDLIDNATSTSTTSEKLEPVAEPLHVAQLSSLLTGPVTNGHEKRIVVEADVYVPGGKHALSALVDNGA